MTPGRLLDIDTTEFAHRFARRPMAVAHHLGDEPRLTVDAVGDLADALPPASVEHNVGKVDAIVADGNAPALEATPGEIARGIDTNGCWMVLKNIEQVPAYRDLLDELLDEVEPSPLVRGEGGMSLREGFVFLSAPGSITPSHVDPEHNFLLQVRGTKDMHVGEFPDPETQQHELERFYRGGHRNLDWMPHRESTYALAPGDGVYVPPHAPHWVENGKTVSVSLSITFRTPTTERTARVHSVNARLRRLRVKPLPPGERMANDRAKEALSRSLQKLKR